MDFQYFITDIARFSLSGIIIFFACYSFIRTDLKTLIKVKSAELQRGGRSELMALQLQARERLILLIERINPTNLILRVHQNDLAVEEMQALLLSEIRREYQHNVSQQLYVDTETWKVVSRLKDDTIAMIGNAGKSLSSEASGSDLCKKLLLHISGLENDPYELTLGLIKRNMPLF